MKFKNISNDRKVSYENDKSEESQSSSFSITENTQKAPKRLKSALKDKQSNLKNTNSSEIEPHLLPFHSLVYQSLPHRATVVNSLSFAADRLLPLALALKAKTALKNLTPLAEQNDAKVDNHKKKVTFAPLESQPELASEADPNVEAEPSQKAAPKNIYKKEKKPNANYVDEEFQISNAIHNNDTRLEDVKRNIENLYDTTLQYSSGYGPNKNKTISHFLFDKIKDDKVEILDQAPLMNKEKAQKIISYATVTAWHDTNASFIPKFVESQKNNPDSTQHLSLQDVAHMVDQIDRPPSQFFNAASLRGKISGDILVGLLDKGAPETDYHPFVDAMQSDSYSMSGLFKGFTADIADRFDELPSGVKTALVNKCLQEEEEPPHPGPQNKPYSEGTRVSRDHGQTVQQEPYMYQLHATNAHAMYQMLPKLPEDARKHVLFSVGNTLKKFKQFDQPDGVRALETMFGKNNPDREQALGTLPRNEQSQWDSLFFQKPKDFIKSKL